MLFAEHMCLTEDKKLVIRVGDQNALNESVDKI